MIICRKCKTHNDDDATECSMCQTDITGRDGIPTGAAAKARAAQPPRSRARPAAEPPARPLPDLDSPAAGSGADGPASDDLADLPPLPEGLDDVPPPRPGEAVEAPWFEDPPAAGDAVSSPDDTGEEDETEGRDEDGDDDEDRVRWSTAKERPKLIVRDDLSGPDQVIERPERESYDHIPEGHRPDEDIDVDEDNIEEVVTTATPLSFGGKVVAEPGRSDGYGVPAATSTVTLLSGQLACDNCGEANDDHRRFCCACGTILPAFTTPRDPDSDVVEPRSSLWRRITGTVNKDGRDGRTRGQRMRDAGQRKLKYRAKRTLRTRLAAVGITAGMLGGGVMALGPWRSRIEGWFEGDPDPVAPSEILLEGEPLDEILFPWSGEGDEVTLVLNLPAPANIDQLVFTPLPNDHEDASNFARPSVVRVGGVSDDIELGNDGRADRVDVRLLGASTIEVTIVAVHDFGWETDPVGRFESIAYVPKT